MNPSFRIAALLLTSGAVGGEPTSLYAPFPVDPCLPAKVGASALETVRLVNDGESGVVEELDTVIDASHSELQGALIYQACFGFRVGSGEVCHNGRSRDVGPRSALNDEGHRTHVSGIEAARGVNGLPGVAPGASMVAVKLLDGCNFAAFSEIATSFSNSNPYVGLLAPGVGISSLAIGGGVRGASGTSMASPHAAGCAALLIQMAPAITPGAVRGRMKATGAPVTDPRNGLVHPRIDCSPGPPLPRGTVPIPRPGD